MKHDQKMLLVFLVITTPFFFEQMWNRFGRVKIYKKFTKVSLEWFIPFFWCWNRTSKYLPRHLNAIHLCGPFFGGQKKMSVYSKDLRPSALKWVFGHVFFRGEDFILQRVFFVKEQTQTKQWFPETSLRGPYFGDNIFWRLQANSLFIQFGGMKRRNTGVNIGNVLTLAIEMHSRGKNHNLSATRMHLFDLPHHSSLRKWHR